MEDKNGVAKKQNWTIGKSEDKSWEWTQLVKNLTWKGSLIPHQNIIWQENNEPVVWYSQERALWAKSYQREVHITF